MKRFLRLAAISFALAVPAGAGAAVTVSTSFNANCTSTTGLINAKAQPACSSSTNGAYGNSVQLTAADGYTKVLVSAWQANQTTNAITSAFLGAYDKGFGVTGLGDSNGSNNLHTIDNIGGYTDFLVLQFNRAVNLTSIGTTPFALSAGTDTDVSYYNANGVINPTAWNTAVNIATSVTGVSNTPSAWTNVDFNATTYGVRTLNTPATQFSTVWLVSASMAITDRDDGFKLGAFVVSQVLPAPEPSTWMMMIFGFGLVGWSMRRRERAALAA